MSDSRSLLNDEEVDFLLEGSDGAKDSGGDQQVVTMRGDLQQISLTDIFQTLSLSKMEGMLRVRNPLEQRHIYFKDGFVRILVPNRIATRRLGQRLVHAGMIDSERLRSALLQQRKENKPLGQLLIEGNACTQEQIDSVLAMQVTEELFGLFTWLHGEFEFFKGAVTDAVLLSRLQNTPEFEVSSLLLEVARRSDEWDGITKSLGSLDEVPARVADAAPDLGRMSEAQQGMLTGIDGKQSYRELAESQLLTLFDAARAARDLVQRGVIVNLPDEAMVTVAREYAAQGHPKRALVLLQTLRDRSGERLLTTVCEIAEVLRDCGEGKLACAMLLQAAELQSDTECALDLARQARALSARDTEVLRFLRKTLIAHGESAQGELEEVTLALVESLIDGPDAEPALLLIEECLKTATNRLPLLQRKVRALQKKKDLLAAVDVMLELAAAYQADGNKEKVLELYEQIIKIDRDRKDVRKIVRQMRTTRAMRYVRFGAVAAAALIVLSTGAVLWRGSVRDRQMQEISAEITRLVRIGDREGARSVLAKAKVSVGECSEVEEIARQIDLAEMAESARVRRVEKKKNQDLLADAVARMQEGKLGEALQIYANVHRKEREDTRSDVADAVNVRLQALQAELESTGKTLTSRLPPPPNDLIDKRKIEEGLTDLRTRFKPSLLSICDEVQRLHDAGGFPDFISQDLVEGLTKAAAGARLALDRAKDRLAEYVVASERVANERRLDPLFKSAQELEKNLDFRGALAAYRNLDRETANDHPLKTHFRDQVERNATIVRLLQEIERDTADGKYDGAKNNYLALRHTYADVPWEKVAWLPVHIETRPPGATVVWNGVESGKTPLLLKYRPGEQNQVVLKLPGFRSESAPVTGADFRGIVRSLMTCQPDTEQEVEGAIERPSASDNSDHIFVADRSGTLTSFDVANNKVAWRWHSGDLSGLLTTPIAWKELVIIGSLDGTVRGLRTDNGTVAWSRPDVPTEVGPALTGSYVAVATTQKKLLLLEAATGNRFSEVTLPSTVHSDVLGFPRAVVVVTDDGQLHGYSIPDLNPIFHVKLGDASSWSAVALADGVAIADESGSVAVYELSNGSRRWQGQLGGHLSGGITSNGRMLAAIASERVVLFDVHDGSQKAKAEAVDESWTGPAAFAGGRLIVPRRDGNLWALDSGSLEVCYQIRGNKRSALRPVPWGASGAVVVGADRKVAVFRKLP